MNKLKEEWAGVTDLTRRARRDVQPALLINRGLRAQIVREDDIHYIIAGQEWMVTKEAVRGLLILLSNTIGQGGR